MPPTARTLPGRERVRLTINLMPIVIKLIGDYKMQRKCLLIVSGTHRLQPGRESGSANGSWPENFRAILCSKELPIIFRSINGHFSFLRDLEASSESVPSCRHTVCTTWYKSIKTNAGIVLPMIARTKPAACAAKPLSRTHLPSGRRVGLRVLLHVPLICFPLLINRFN